MEEKNMRLLRIGSAIRALWIFLCIFLLQLVSAALWNCFCWLTQYSPEKDMAWEQIFILHAFLCILWCGSLYRRSSWREEHFDYKRAFSIRNLFAVISLGMGGCVVAGMLMTLLQSVFPSGFVQYQQTMEQFGKGNVILIFIYVLLMGPIAEELIFRGAILDSLHLAFPFWLANLLQAALFALYHMNLVQGIYAFCLGLVFGLIREAIGSVFCNIAAHILFNLTNYLLQWLFPANGKLHAVLFWVIFLAGIIFFAGALWYTWLVYSKKQQDGKEREL